MKSADYHGRKVTAPAEISPEAGNGTHTGAGPSPSREELEQRIAELEKQAAELVKANKELAGGKSRTLGAVGSNRDAADQKDAEAKLAYERQLFHTLLESTPDHTYFKDRESRFVRVSRSSAEFMLESARKTHRAAHPDDKPDEWPPHLAGVKSFTEWLIGKTDFEIFPGEHARTAFEDEQGIIRTGKPIIDKLRKVTFADGGIHWWFANKLPWRDQDGNIVGTFGVSRDVTQLKEAEELLDRERHLLRTLIDNLPDFIYAKDKQGRFVLNNAAHARVNGAKTPAEMKGKSDFDYFAPEVARQFFDDERKIIETGRPVLNQEQYKCRPGDKTGQKRWSVCTKVLWRDDKGEILGTVGITRDIMEQKEAEAKLVYEKQLFHTLLESTPDHTYFKDRESRFVQVSRSSAEFMLESARKTHRAAHPGDKPDEWPPPSGRRQIIHRMADRQD